MKLMIAWVVFVLLLLAASVFAQSQPPGIVLDANSMSRIFPPFETEGWVLTRGSGDATHVGDDFFAQDWARDCHTDGQKVYAGIAGSVDLNPANDGRMDYYGNTIVVADYQSGFAQRFAHLQKFAPGLQSGDLVLAGQFLGYVGATGNVAASAACAAQGGRGAHAHIALYKNLPRGSGRPISSAVLSGGSTAFAAPFNYVAPAVLIKSIANPTVFVLQGNQKIPVSAAVFASQGWNFDQNRIMFDPLRGNEHTQAAIDGLATANWFWPMRNGSLIKSPNDPTVYLVSDGQRRGLPRDIFGCRGYDFAEVKTLPGSELANHPPVGSAPVANHCVDEARQALLDMAHVSNFERRISAAQLGTYQYDPGWDSGWDLRWMNFGYEGGRVTYVYHATLRSDSAVRYLMYWDPVANRWEGWFGM